MGYSKSKLSVERFIEILTLLANSTKDVRVKSPDPDKLAYKIREAFRVAKLYPNTYPEFQTLGEKYTIKTKDEYVYFNLKNSLISGELEELANSLVMKFDDCIAPITIVGSLVKHKPVEASYPKAMVTTDMLKMIYSWTSKNGYYIVDTEPLTISRTETPESWIPKSS